VNIVLIVSDTLRRDHVGCYDNAWIHTPHLDRLAERSFVFDRCYAASFPTVPNRSDLLTGSYNFTYLGWKPLPQSELTLPQLLAAAGFFHNGRGRYPVLREKRLWL
jgi:arylsulfatase A-like enzyme